ncbi:hypothetical protein Halar_0654 (plasmid) [halophilic archaeon DL31]|jgi:hypothetical protein|nr:hypothetical protein Halar_0654 [halophilic archaeon DL31]
MSHNLADNRNGGTDKVSELDAADAEEIPEGATGDPSGADESPELSLDVTFEILRNRRRQLVLEFLRERDEMVTIGELAEHIAAIENDTTVRQLNAQQRKRVYIGLYQCHLPKMADVGVIEFNKSRGNISPGEHIEPLYEYLDVTNGRTGDGDGDGDDNAGFHPFQGVSVDHIENSLPPPVEVEFASSMRGQFSK